MRVAVMVLLALSACASSGAVRRLEADASASSERVRRLTWEQAAMCQRFEEYQRAHGGITHPCRPTGASVDVAPVKVFGGAR